jgi:hypothetical protein
MKPLFGDADEGPTLSTPRYGIQYKPRGFDVYRKNAVKKARKALAELGVPQRVIDEFADYAARFRDPQYIPNLIDEQWQQRFGEWCSCGTGSKAERIARAVNTRELLFIIEPGRFPVPGAPGDGMAHGWAHRDGKVAQVTVVLIASLTVPQNAYLVELGNVIEWECGNLMAIRAGFRPTSVDGEVGNKNPCGLIR